MLDDENALIRLRPLANDRSFQKRFAAAATSTSWHYPIWSGENWKSASIRPRCSMFIQTYP